MELKIAKDLKKYERKDEMKKEEFLSLGISEELADKAAKASEKELEGYVPKHQFEELETENTNLKETAKENEKSLENLKSTVGSQEELTTQIQKMQEEAKETEKKHKEELEELRMMNAIKLAIAGKTQDEELVAGLIDRKKLFLGDDGKISGLEEQLKTLKESKSFLFKEERTEKPGFHKIGGNPPESGQKTDGRVSMKEAIQAKLQSQTSQN